MSERIKQSELAAVVAKEQEKKGGYSEIHGEGQPVKFTGSFTFERIKMPKKRVNWTNSNFFAKIKPYS